MIVQMTEEEREVMLRLVQREIADLGPEIRHTAATSFREDLKVEKQTLQHLLQHLREAKGYASTT